MTSKERPLVVGGATLFELAGAAGRTAEAVEEMLAKDGIAVGVDWRGRPAVEAAAASRFWRGVAAADEAHQARHLAWRTYLEVERPTAREAHRLKAYEEALADRPRLNRFAAANAAFGIISLTHAAQLIAAEAEQEWEKQHPPREFAEWMTKGTGL